MTDEIFGDAFDKCDTFILPDNEDECAGCEKRFNENDVSFYVVIGSDGEPEFWHSKCYATLTCFGCGITKFDTRSGWREIDGCVFCAECADFIEKSEIE